ncbi:hypothetical protein GALMADRAFT_232721 [Galerina marginata CBS 339.88]|uniref:Uncharacterized protein n=1 Tax=Galerina marginata (strain CBS 339.88) TaxID=685588 RepID=A0A067S5Q0_GALM3|nr:hypothetical protein GALMADRAFT_232721 [Galerina marginata CBS 339.88]
MALESRRNFNRSEQLSLILKQVNQLSCLVWSVVDILCPCCGSAIARRHVNDIWLDIRPILSWTKFLEETNKVTQARLCYDRHSLRIFSLSLWRLGPCFPLPKKLQLVAIKDRHVIAKTSLAIRSLSLSKE